MHYPQSNALLLAELDKYVVGHLEAKKALIVMLGRSRLRSYQKHVKYMDNEFLISPLKVLLIGASGTGKTHLLDSLQRIAYFPIVKVDATHLNPTGGSGGITPKDLKKMIYEAALEACQTLPATYPIIEYAIDNTVVFIDEIDKLGRNFDSSGNWNKHVQSNFLTLIDNKDEYSGVSFVFAGAFEGITKIVDKPRSIGFTEHSTTTQKELLDNRILSTGLIPEIVGRINSIVELDVFTKKDLSKILTERIIPKKALDLAAYGVFNCDVSRKEINRIAEDAVKSGQGIRYLQREIDKKFLDLEFCADYQDMLYLPEY